MPTLPYLLFSYGLMFGFQNKVTFLRGKLSILDALLNCTYCLGFHTGWMAWIAYLLVEHPSLPRVPPETIWFLGRGAVVWAFTSAASCYILDVTTRWLEHLPKK